MRVEIETQPGRLEQFLRKIPLLRRIPEKLLENTVKKFIEKARENMENQGFPTDGPMYKDITYQIIGNTAIVEFVPYAAVHEFGAQWKMTKAQMHKIRRLIEEGILKPDYEPPKRGWITIPSRPFIRPALVELKLEGEIL